VDSTVEDEEGLIAIGASELDRQANLLEGNTVCQAKSHSTKSLSVDSTTEINLLDSGTLTLRC
jgi:hypothetical protein